MTMRGNKELRSQVRWRSLRMVRTEYGAKHAIPIQDCVSSVAALSEAQFRT